MTFRKTRAILVLAAMLAGTPLLAQAGEQVGEAPDATVPAVIDAEGRAAIAGINAFSLDLYRRTQTPGENHFLSPASVSVAVGLAYRGARGQTASELAQVLRYGLPPQDYLRVNAQVLTSMDFGGKGRELRTGNAIWLQTGTPLLPDYERDIARYAGAGLQRVDFKADPEAARGQVNLWVAERTRDKIPELLPRGIVQGSTRAILVNTIYWKGAWTNRFRKEDTKQEPFTTLAGRKIITALMNQQDHFQALQRDGIKAILLPYQGDEIEMAVFLPDRPGGLRAFEARLDAKGLARWIAELEASRGQRTILTLPKMHVEWGSDLVPTFEAMGARLAFTDGADFQGMIGFPLPGEPRVVGVKITNIIHKTFLDVDEEATEAVAATAVVMGDIVISAQRPIAPPFIFRADKPFLFLLRDRRTGLILFMGRYVAPPPN